MRSPSPTLVSMTAVVNLPECHVVLLCTGKCFIITQYSYCVCDFSLKKIASCLADWTSDGPLSGEGLEGGCCGCAGARVVAKAYPEERVGVFAQKNGRVEVVEYSELAPSEASALDSGGC